MSGKVKVEQRTTTNSVSNIAFDVNEKILRSCHEFYTQKDTGLIAIGSSLGLPLLAPRKKITVMLMGNHSAGKSAFINWYVEEHVQKTGVAIETQGFSFVTSGRKRESLTGNATLHLYPHFQPLQQIEGVTDYVNTEISTSKARKFALVTFIDTPGLVDGDMKYPFDVNQALLWLGDLCDLVFVFFDPIGQALCRRTLDIVEELNMKHPDRIHFYLSKADDAGLETDRQRVMMQIVQELCKRPGLNKTGFDMPTIFIPNQNKIVRCTNQIEECCTTIQKTIERTVQHTLNQLESDCEAIVGLVDNALRLDDTARRINFKSRVRGAGFSLLGLALPVLQLLVVLLSSAPLTTLHALFGEPTTTSLMLYLSPLLGFWVGLGSQNQAWGLAVCLSVSGLLLVISRLVAVKQPTLQKKNRVLLIEKKQHVKENVMPRKQSMYEEYLRQSVSEHDL
ncbi:GTP binding domain [Trinorchestia longiramus]|nr:GTP binding domain [Trinorchestia longiramus]